MKSQRNQLQKWLDFTQRIHSSLVLEEALKTTLDVALDLTGMERACISLFDPEGNLEFRKGQNKKGEVLTQEDFSSSQEAVQKSLDQQETFYFFKEAKTTHEVRSGFSVPLFSHRSTSDNKKVLGVLYGDTPQLIHFGEQEKETVDVIALHAGPALEAAVFYEMATRDVSTGVYLRHYFYAMAFVEWKRTLRHRHPISVLLIDVDQFKSINESYGRKEGELVLKKTAATLKYASRAEDIIARYGGDEFIVLLPETDVPGVKRVAKRIQEHLPQSGVQENQPLTVSIGAATYPRCAVTNIQDLVKLAETALTQAKQSGANRLIVYEPSLLQTHTKLF